jgi:hypothetical protein
MKTTILKIFEKYSDQGIALDIKLFNKILTEIKFKIEKDKKISRVLDLSEKIKEPFLSEQTKFIEDMLGWWYRKLSEEDTPVNYMIGGFVCLNTKYQDKLMSCYDVSFKNLYTNIILLLDRYGKKMLNADILKIVHDVYRERKEKDLTKTNLKYFINYFYGVHVNNDDNYNYVPAFGNAMLRYLYNEDGENIIYTDTDMLIYKDNITKEKRLEWVRNRTKNLFELENQYDIETGIFLRKKRYLLFKDDKVVKCVGFTKGI